MRMNDSKYVHIAPCILGCMLLHAHELTHKYPHYHTHTHLRVPASTLCASILHMSAHASLVCVHTYTGMCIHSNTHAYSQVHLCESYAHAHKKIHTQKSIELGERVFRLSSANIRIYICIYINIYSVVYVCIYVLFMYAICLGIIVIITFQRARNHQQ